MDEPKVPTDIRKDPMSKPTEVLEKTSLDMAPVTKNPDNLETPANPTRVNPFTLAEEKTKPSKVGDP